MRYKQFSPKHAENKGEASAANDIARRRDRDLLDDLDAEAFEAGDFARMIGQQADALEVQVGEDLGADADFALGAALALGQRRQALFVMELQRQLFARASRPRSPSKSDADR